MKYGNGRIVPDIMLADPSTFTDGERAAHARIYAETGSKIAAHMAGLDLDPSTTGGPMTSTLSYPTGIDGLPACSLPPGTIVQEMDRAPAVGDTIALYSRGRVRLARAGKVTPTRVQAEYVTSSSPAFVTRPWAKLSHTIDAPAPGPEAIVLQVVSEEDAQRMYALLRSWRIVEPSRPQRRGFRAGGHRLEPFPEVDPHTQGFGVRGGAIPGDYSRMPQD